MEFSNEIMDIISKIMKEEHVEYEYLAYAERGAQACVRILKIGSVEQE